MDDALMSLQHQHVQMPRSGPGMVSFKAKVVGPVWEGGALVSASWLHCYLQELGISNTFHRYLLILLSLSIERRHTQSAQASSNFGISFEERCEEQCSSNYPTHGYRPACKTSLEYMNHQLLLLLLAAFIYPLACAGIIIKACAATSASSSSSFRLIHQLHRSAVAFQPSSFPLRRTITTTMSSSASTTLMPHLLTLKTKSSLILASKSPRRQEILGLMGFAPNEFQIIPSTFPEDLDKSSM